MSPEPSRLFDLFLVCLSSVYLTSMTGQSMPTKPVPVDETSTMQRQIENLTCSVRFVASGRCFCKQRHNSQNIVLSDLRRCVRAAHMHAQHPRKHTTQPQRTAHTLVIAW